MIHLWLFQSQHSLYTRGQRGGYTDGTDVTTRFNAPRWIMVNAHNVFDYKNGFHGSCTLSVRSAEIYCDLRNQIFLKEKSNLKLHLAGLKC